MELVKLTMEEPLLSVVKEGLESIKINANVFFFYGISDGDVDGKVVVNQSVIARGVVVESSKGSVSDGEFELFGKEDEAEHGNKNKRCKRTQGQH